MSAPGRLVDLGRERYERLMNNLRPSSALNAALCVLKNDACALTYSMPRLIAGSNQRQLPVMRDRWSAALSYVLSMSTP